MLVDIDLCLKENLGQTNFFFFNRNLVHTLKHQEEIIQSD